MTLFKHGLSLATLFLLINALFVSSTWAEAFPRHERFSSGFSLPVKSLAKRTSAYYDTCKNKGSGLICATGYSDATALIKFDRSIVATALTRDQLTACGWTIDQNPYTGLAENFVQYVGQTMLNELGISPSNNVVVNWEHTVAVDSTHPATGANYQCWYNTANNAIIVDLAWSPGFKKEELQVDGKWDSSDSLPAIQQLSDVMWIEWAARASDPSTIKYMFQMNVVNLNTRAIIEEAISIDTANDASAAEVFYWEFDMSTETGQALLGTPNGNPQAWFLINHKTALGADQSVTPVTGLKTISKVRIWTNEEQCYIPELDVEDSDSDEDVDMDDSAGMAPCYHMLFYIADS